MWATTASTVRARRQRLYEPDTTNTKIYFSNNYHDTNKNGLLDSQTASGPTLVNGNYTPLGSRVNLSPVNTTDPRTAYIEVMSHSGATGWPTRTTATRFAM